MNKKIRLQDKIGYIIAVIGYIVFTVAGIGNIIYGFWVALLSNEEYQTYIRKIYSLAITAKMQGKTRTHYGGMMFDQWLDNIGGQLFVSSFLIIEGICLTIYLIHRFRRREKDIITWLGIKRK